MVFFNPLEKYRGRRAADPKKTREERERELHQMAATQEGLEIITILYNEATGRPHGVGPDIGTLVKGEMIPVILRHEYGDK
jgi:hypothetical protein